MGVLLERHWEPVHAYAALCTDLTGGHPAALGAAALHQVLKVLGRSGPAVALRPQLLMTVRHIAEAWALDRHWARRPADAGAAPPGLGVDRDRRLALISFCGLSPAGQCLLWHTAVEAEPVSVPAALLALDTGSALTELELARGQFRSGLLHTHAERAEHPLCRLYNRMIDAQTRRGKTLLPDVRQHLLGCPDCAAVAEQLGTFERRLGELLGQAVLGRPAADYLSSRSGHPDPDPAGTDSAQPTSRADRPRRPGRHRVPTGAPDPVRVSGAVPRGYARALLTGVGLASALALGAAVTTTLWPVGSAIRSGPAAPGGAVPRPGSGGAGPATPARTPAAREATGGAAGTPTRSGPRDAPVRAPEAPADHICRGGGNPDGTGGGNPDGTGGGNRDREGPDHDLAMRGGPLPRWLRDLTGSPTATVPPQQRGTGVMPPAEGRPTGIGEGPPGTAHATRTAQEPRPTAHPTATVRQAPRRAHPTGTSEKLPTTGRPVCAD